LITSLALTLVKPTTFAVALLVDADDVQLRDRLLVRGGHVLREHHVLR
jgi:hypothetical protein